MYMLFSSVRRVESTGMGNIIIYFSKAQSVIVPAAILKSGVIIDAAKLGAVKFAHIFILVP